MERTGWGMFPAEHFDIIGVDPLGSATTELISSHRNNSHHLSRKMKFLNPEMEWQEVVQKTAVIWPAQITWILK